MTVKKSLHSHSLFPLISHILVYIILPPVTYLPFVVADAHSKNTLWYNAGKTLQKVNRAIPWKKRKQGKQKKIK